MAMKRDDSIESLRAIAIILVLGIHITGDPIISESTGLYAYLSYAFQNIRMPLFTVISGYLYAQRRVIQGYFIRFSKGKFRRILIPLVFVASCEFLSKSVLPYVNNPTELNEYWKAMLYPYEHYWFLQAIFIIFLLVGGLDAAGIMKSFRSWCLILSMSIITYLVSPKISFNVSLFSIGYAIYLLPYFLLGYGLTVYREKLYANNILYAAVAFFAIGYVFQNYFWFTDNTEYSRPRTILGLIVSVTASFLLVRYRVAIWGLSFIGSFAFTIYLYQGFALSIGRRMADMVGIENPHFYFIFIVLFALGFGIGISLSVSKIPFVRTIMLGVR